MNAQHTPGQWVAKTNQPDREFSWMVCSPSFTNWALAEECKEADARLMAAAPDLLEALQGALAAWDRLYPSMPVNSAYEDCEFKEMQSVRAAIAKATGGQA